MLLIDIDPDYCEKMRKLPGFDHERYTYRLVHEQQERMKKIMEPIDVPALEERPTGLVEELVTKIVRERDDMISKIIRDGLKIYGFEFDSDYEFRDFCKERVIRAHEVGSEVYSYYLDGENQLICVIDETINVPALKNPWSNY